MNVPKWFAAMQKRDLALLRGELRKVPDIDKEWYAAPGWCTYNPLGWAAFMFRGDLEMLQCVIDAGADLSHTCRSFFDSSYTFHTILEYTETLIIDYDALQVARVLVKNGARYKGTEFESWVKQQHENNCAIAWCFANVVPPGARDIGFDFLERFQELPWEPRTWPWVTTTKKKKKRLKTI